MILEKKSDISNATQPDTRKKAEKSSGPRQQGPGDRAAVRVKELTLQSVYNTINFYKNKLRNTNLTSDEYLKISNDIDQMEQSLPKMERELREAKEDLEKNY